jgi:hypothetical protein
MGPDLPDQPYRGTLQVECCLRTACAGRVCMCSYRGVPPKAAYDIRLGNSGCSDITSNIVLKRQWFSGICSRTVDGAHHVVAAGSSQEVQHA